jgi:hypothetical protein
MNNNNTSIKFVYTDDNSSPNILHLKDNFGNDKLLPNTVPMQLLFLIKILFLAIWSFGIKLEISGKRSQLEPLYRKCLGNIGGIVPDEGVMGFTYIEKQICDGRFVQELNSNDLAKHLKKSKSTINTQYGLIVAKFIGNNTNSSTYNSTIIHNRFLRHHTGWEDKGEE